MKKQPLPGKGTVIGLVLGLVLVASSMADAATSEEINAALSSNSLAFSKSRLARLKDFYSKRQMQPAFGDAQTSVLSKQSLISLLSAHGLESSKYLPKVDASCPAEITGMGVLDVNCELALSEALVRIADHIQNGQLDPASVDFENIKMPKKTQSSAQGLSQTLDSNPSGVLSFIDQQAPQNFMYQRHKFALAKFLQVKAGGGWNTVRLSKKKLSLGSKNDAVGQIKNILVGHGYRIDVMDNNYDEQTQAAVKDLQVAALLQPTGVVDSANATIFNQFFAIDLDRRIARLKLDLEKLRWMPNQLESSFIFVGLGEQQLTWFDTATTGGIKMQFKTVNGRTDRKTPMMRDTITSVILNPSWTVPPGVLAKDKLPLFKSQSQSEMYEYFNTNYYTLVDMNSSQLIDPLYVNWAMITGANINFYIRQRPGIHNALGVFKFNLTNPYAIYLHDTNAKQLFQEPSRLLSSGCVRLEQPQILAEELLRGSSWDHNKIESTIAHYPGEVPATSTTIGLKNKLPVYLMYMTSSVKEDGIVRFHPDYYGMNALMLNVLEKVKNEI